jgi:hypothetical protein
MRAIIDVGALAIIGLLISQQGNHADMKKNIATSDKTVMTPSGPRPQSDVHNIAPGHVLDSSGGRLRELDEDGNVVADYGPVPSTKTKGPVMPRPAGSTEPKSGR